MPHVITQRLALLLQIRIAMNARIKNSNIIYLFISDIIYITFLCDLYCSNYLLVARSYMVTHFRL